MIGHPPCTRLANSGVRWLHERDLWEEMKSDADFFMSLWLAPINRICLENPVQHKHARIHIPVPDQYIQPWQFGHGETKRTGLWLKNLPPLEATEIVKERRPRVHQESPGPDRWKARSRTLQGIADAMAAQWGTL